MRVMGLMMPLLDLEAVGILVPTSLIGRYRVCIDDKKMYLYADLEF